METRLALKNVGRINPRRLEDYIAAGGYAALPAALGMSPDHIVAELIKSGLRGRGGAGFSTGMKKKFTSESTCRLLECMRYIVCNADEGEPGTYKDRIIMENDPHLLVEGMIIAAYAVGADQGYVYIRGEYAQAIETIRLAVEQAYKGGYLGENILGSGYCLNMEVKIGAGSYLCGEELTLLESLEGNRGYPRVKPPYPAESGLFGMPTLVNNVETLAHIPAIVANGSGWYRGLGTSESPGTKIFTISGDVNRPGYYEAQMGIPLRQLIQDLAGGIKGDQQFKAALLGGAAGTFVPESLLDIPLAFETLKAEDATLGSGAVIVLDREKSIPSILASILGFFRHESCGKCVPCRVGTHQLCLALDGIQRDAKDKAAQIDGLVGQAKFMARTSLCPLGQSPILPIASAVRYFRDEF